MTISQPSRGTFVPAPESECNERIWYTSAYDIEGHPIPGVRKRYDTWKRGQSMQKFYTAVEHNRGNQPIWQGPESDCSHSMFHVHPNGHHPPSGEQLPLVKIMDLYDENDVLTAWKIAGMLMDVTILHVLMNGGVWNEQRIAEAAVECADQASSGVN